MLIDGKPVSGVSGKTIDVVNPSNEEVVGKIWQASPEEIDAPAKIFSASFQGIFIQASGKVSRRLMDSTPKLYDHFS